MGWQSLLWIGAIVVLLVVLMRGRGGMAGCCGMGARRPSDGADADSRSQDAAAKDKHRAA